MNEEFNEFIADLYYSIRRDKKKLQKIYKTVEKCIYEWNGGSYGSKCINLRNDVEGYIVSTELDLEPDLSAFKSILTDEQFDFIAQQANETHPANGEPWPELKGNPCDNREDRHY